MFSHKAKKLTTFFVLFCFIGSEIARANPELARPLSSGAEAPYFTRLDIPAELGTVEEIHLPPGRKDFPFVIHIQTVHAHYETAHKIREIIRYFKKQYGVQCIFAEGASEKLHPEYLNFVSDSRLRRQEQQVPASVPESWDSGLNQKIVDALAKKGELTAVDLALSDSGLEAFGIEKPDFYRHAYHIFKKVFENQDQSETFLKEKRLALDRQASRIFDRELRMLVDCWLKFNSGKKDLLGVFRLLRKDAKEGLGLDFENPFSQFDWPQLTRLALLQELEKRQDQEQFEKERKKILGWLKSRKIATNFFDDLETGDSPRKSAENFLEKTVPQGFRFSDYPQITYRAAHKVLQSELQLKPLFEEIERLFSKLLDAKADTEEKREIIGLYRNFLLLGKLLHLELTAGEWEQIRSNEESPEIQANGSIQKTIKAAFRFYRLMQRRESAFFTNIQETLSGLRRRGQQVPASVPESWDSGRKTPKAVILVTGGFHTQGMSRLFKDQNIGYALISPKISGEIDHSLYYEIMTRTSHLEQTLFTQDPRVSLEKQDWDIQSQKQSVERVYRELGIAADPRAPYFAAIAASLGQETKAASTVNEFNLNTRRHLLPFSLTQQIVTEIRKSLGIDTHIYVFDSGWQEVEVDALKMFGDGDRIADGRLLRVAMESRNLLVSVPDLDFFAGILEQILTNSEDGTTEWDDYHKRLLSSVKQRMNSLGSEAAQSLGSTAPKKSLARRFVVSIHDMNILKVRGAGNHKRPEFLYQELEDVIGFPLLAGLFMSQRNIMIPRAMHPLTSLSQGFDQRASAPNKIFIKYQRIRHEYVGVEFFYQNRRFRDAAEFLGFAKQWTHERFGEVRKFSGSYLYYVPKLTEWRTILQARGMRVVRNVDSADDSRVPASDATALARLVDPKNAGIIYRVKRNVPAKEYPRENSRDPDYYARVQVLVDGHWLSYGKFRKQRERFYHQLKWPAELSVVGWLKDFLAMLSRGKGKNFVKFVYYPGMLWRAKREGWANGKWATGVGDDLGIIRTTFHEAEDEGIVQDGAGNNFNLEAGDPVPAPYHGRVVAVAPDFMGESVFIRLGKTTSSVLWRFYWLLLKLLGVARSEFPPELDRPGLIVDPRGEFELVSYLMHLKSEVKKGDNVDDHFAQSRPIARLADPAVNGVPVPPHVHSGFLAFKRHYLLIFPSALQFYISRFFTDFVKFRWRRAFLLAVEAFGYFKRLLKEKDKGYDFDKWGLDATVNPGNHRGDVWRIGSFVRADRKELEQVAILPALSEEAAEAQIPTSRNYHDLSVNEETDEFTGLGIASILLAVSLSAAAGFGEHEKISDLPSTPPQAVSSARSLGDAAVKTQTVLAAVEEMVRLFKIQPNRNRVPFAREVIPALGISRETFFRHRPAMLKLLREKITDGRLAPLVKKRIRWAIRIDEDPIAGIAEYLIEHFKENPAIEEFPSFLDLAGILPVKNSTLSDYFPKVIAILEVEMKKKNFDGSVRKRLEEAIARYRDLPQLIADHILGVFQRESDRNRLPSHEELAAVFKRSDVNIRHTLLPRALEILKRKMSEGEYDYSLAERIGLAALVYTNLPLGTALYLIHLFRANPDLWQLPSLRALENVLGREAHTLSDHLRQIFKTLEGAFEWKGFDASLREKLRQAIRTWEASFGERKQNLRDKPIKHGAFDLEASVHELIGLLKDESRRKAKRPFYETLKIGTALIETAKKGEAVAIGQAVDILANDAETELHEYAIRALRYFPDQARVHRVLRQVVYDLLRKSSPGNWSRIGQYIRDEDPKKFQRYWDLVGERVLVKLLPQYIEDLGYHADRGESGAAEILARLRGVFDNLLEEGRKVVADIGARKAFEAGYVVPDSNLAKILAVVLDSRITNHEALASQLGIDPAEVTRALAGDHRPGKPVRLGGYERLIQRLRRSDPDFLTLLQQTFDPLIPRLVIQEIIKGTDSREKEYLTGVVRTLAAREERQGGLLYRDRALPALIRKIKDPGLQVAKQDLHLYMENEVRSVNSSEALNAVARPLLAEPVSKDPITVYPQVPLLDSPIRVGQFIYSKEAGKTTRRPYQPAKTGTTSPRERAGIMEFRPAEDYRIRTAKKDGTHQIRIHTVQQVVDGMLAIYSREGILPRTKTIARELRMNFSHLWEVRDEVTAELRKRGIPIWEGHWSEVRQKARTEIPAKWLEGSVSTFEIAQDETDEVKILGLTFSGVQEFRRLFERTQEVQIERIEFRVTGEGIQLFGTQHDLLGKEGHFIYRIPLNADGSFKGMAGPDTRKASLLKLLEAQGYPVPLVHEKDSITFGGRSGSTREYLASIGKYPDEVRFYAYQGGGQDSRIEIHEAYGAKRLLGVVHPGSQKGAAPLLNLVEDKRPRGIFEISPKERLISLDKATGMPTRYRATELLKAMRAKLADTRAFVYSGPRGGNATLAIKLWDPAQSAERVLMELPIDRLGRPAYRPGYPEALREAAQGQEQYSLWKLAPIAGAVSPALYRFYTSNAHKRNEEALKFFPQLWAMEKDFPMTDYIEKGQGIFYDVAGTQIKGWDTYAARQEELLRQMGDEIPVLGLRAEGDRVMIYAYIKKGGDLIIRELDQIQLKGGRIEKFEDKETVVLDEIFKKQSPARVLEIKNNQFWVYNSVYKLKSFLESPGVTGEGAQATLYPEEGNARIEIAIEGLPTQIINLNSNLLPAVYGPEAPKRAAYSVAKVLDRQAEAVENGEGDYFVTTLELDIYKTRRKFRHLQTGQDFLDYMAWKTPEDLRKDHGFNTARKAWNENRSAGEQILLPPLIPSYNRQGPAEVWRRQTALMVALSNEEREKLWHRMKRSGGDTARDQLIESFIPIVNQLARRRSGMDQHEENELVQNGLLIVRERIAAWRSAKTGTTSSRERAGIMEFRPAKTGTALSDFVERDLGNAMWRRLLEGRFKFGTKSLDAPFDGKNDDSGNFLDTLKARVEEDRRRMDDLGDWLMERIRQIAEEDKRRVSHPEQSEGSPSLDPSAQRPQDDSRRDQDDSTTLNPETKQAQAVRKAEGLADERDRESLLPVILSPEKHEMAAKLADWFKKNGFREEVSRLGIQNAGIYMIGSFSRFGNARKTIPGEYQGSDLNLMIVNDATPAQAEGLKNWIRDVLNGDDETLDRNGTLVVNLGKNGSYQHALDSGNGFVSILRTHGIDNPEKGFASIEIVPLPNGHGALQPDDSIQERAQMRAAFFVTFTDPRWEELGTNGVLVMENREGASRHLADLAQKQFGNRDKIREYQEEFLAVQADKIREAQRKKPGKEEAPSHVAYDGRLVWAPGVAMQSRQISGEAVFLDSEEGRDFMPGQAQGAQVLFVDTWKYLRGMNPLAPKEDARYAERVRNFFPHSIKTLQVLVFFNTKEGESEHLQDSLNTIRKNFLGRAAVVIKDPLDRIKLARFPVVVELEGHQAKVIVPHNVLQMPSSPIPLSRDRERRHAAAVDSSLRRRGQQVPASVPESWDSGKTAPVEQAPREDKAKKAKAKMTLDDRIELLNEALDQNPPDLVEARRQYEILKPKILKKGPVVQARHGALIERAKVALFGQLASAQSLGESESNQPKGWGRGIWRRAQEFLAARRKAYYDGQLQEADGFFAGVNFFAGDSPAIRRLRDSIEPEEILRNHQELIDIARKILNALPDEKLDSDQKIRKGNLMEKADAYRELVSDALIKLRSGPSDPSAQSLGNESGRRFWGNSRGVMLATGAVFLLTAGVLVAGWLPSPAFGLAVSGINTFVLMALISHWVRHETFDFRAMGRNFLKGFMVVSMAGAFMAVTAFLFPGFLSSLWQTYLHLLKHQYPFLMSALTIFFSAVVGDFLAQIIEKFRAGSASMSLGQRIKRAFWDTPLPLVLLDGILLLFWFRILDHWQAGWNAWGMNPTASIFVKQFVYAVIFVPIHDYVFLGLLIGLSMTRWRDWFSGKVLQNFRQSRAIVNQIFTGTYVKDLLFWQVVIHPFHLFWLPHLLAGQPEAAARINDIRILVIAAGGTIWAMIISLIAHVEKKPDALSPAPPSEAEESSPFSVEAGQKISQAFVVIEKWQGLPIADREMILQSLDHAARLATEPVENRDDLIRTVGNILTRLDKIPGMDTNSSHYQAMVELKQYFEGIPQTGGDGKDILTGQSLGQGNRTPEKAAALPQKVLLLTFDDAYGVAVLQELSQSQHQVVGVVVGRSGTPGVIKLARKLGIPIHYVPDGFGLPDINRRLKENALFRLAFTRFKAKLKKLEPDIAVMAYFSKIPSEMFDIPKKKFFNIHPSALPEFRGGHPLTAAILAGASEMGITVHEVSEGLDEGKIVNQRLAIPIGAAESASDLWGKTAPIAADLLLETINQVTLGQSIPVSQLGQPQHRAFSKSRINGVAIEDTKEIDWRTLAGDEIVRRVRAWNLPPHNQAYTSISSRNASHRVHISQAEILPGTYRGKPGEILEVREEGGRSSYVVKTIDGAVLIQFEENNPWLKQHLLRTGRILGLDAEAQSLGNGPQELAALKAAIRQDVKGIKGLSDKLTPAVLARLDAVSKPSASEVISVLGVLPAGKAGQIARIITTFHKQRPRPKSLSDPFQILTGDSPSPLFNPAQPLSITSPGGFMQIQSKDPSAWIQYFRNLAENFLKKIDAASNEEDREQLFIQFQHTFDFLAERMLKDLDDRRVAETLKGVQAFWQGRFEKGLGAFFEHFILVQKKFLDPRTYEETQWRIFELVNQSADLEARLWSWWVYIAASMYHLRHYGFHAELGGVTEPRGVDQEVILHLLRKYFLPDFLQWRRDHLNDPMNRSMLWALGLIFDYRVYDSESGNYPFERDNQVAISQGKKPWRLDSKDIFPNGARESIPYYWEPIFRDLGNDLVPLLREMTELYREDTSAAEPAFVWDGALTRPKSVIPMLLKEGKSIHDLATTPRKWIWEMLAQVDKEGTALANSMEQYTVNPYTALAEALAFAPDYPRMMEHLVRQTNKLIDWPLIEKNLVPLYGQLLNEDFKPEAILTPDVSDTLTEKGAALAFQIVDILRLVGTQFYKNPIGLGKTSIKSYEELTPGTIVQIHQQSDNVFHQRPVTSLVLAKWGDRDEHVLILNDEGKLVSYETGEIERQLNDIYYVHKIHAQNSGVFAAEKEFRKENRHPDFPRSMSWQEANLLSETGIVGVVRAINRLPFAYTSSWSYSALPSDHSWDDVFHHYGRPEPKDFLEAIGGSAKEYTDQPYAGFISIRADYESESYGDFERRINAIEGVRIIPSLKQGPYGEEKLILIAAPQELLNPDREAEYEKYMAGRWNAVREVIEALDSAQSLGDDTKGLAEVRKVLQNSSYDRQLTAFNQFFDREDTRPIHEALALYLLYHPSQSIRRLAADRMVQMQIEPSVLLEALGRAEVRMEPFGLPSGVTQEKLGLHARINRRHALIYILGGILMNEFRTAYQTRVRAEVHRILEQEAEQWNPEKDRQSWALIQEEPNRVLKVDRDLGLFETLRLMVLRREYYKGKSPSSERYPKKDPWLLGNVQLIYPPSPTAQFVLNEQSTSAARVLYALAPSAQSLPPSPIASGTAGGASLGDDRARRVEEILKQLPGQALTPYGKARLRFLGQNAFKFSTVDFLMRNYPRIAGFELGPDKTAAARLRDRFLGAHDSLYGRYLQLAPPEVAGFERKREYVAMVLLGMIFSQEGIKGIRDFLTPYFQETKLDYQSQPSPGKAGSGDPWYQIEIGKLSALLKNYLPNPEILRSVLLDRTQLSQEKFLRYTTRTGGQRDITGPVWVMDERFATWGDALLDQIILRELWRQYGWPTRQATNQFIENQRAALASSENLLKLTEIVVQHAGLKTVPKEVRYGSTFFEILLASIYRSQESAGGDGIEKASEFFFSLLEVWQGIAAGNRQELPQEVQSFIENHRKQKAGEASSAQSLGSAPREIAGLLERAQKAATMDELYGIARELGRAEKIDFISPLRQIEKFTKPVKNEAHQINAEKTREKILHQAKKFIELYHATFSSDGIPEGRIVRPATANPDKRAQYLNLFPTERIERGIRNVRELLKDEGESPVLDFNNLPTLKRFRELTGIDFDVYGVLEYMSTRPGEDTPRPTLTGSFKRRQFVNLYIENRARIDAAGGIVSSFINSSGNAIQGDLQTVRILVERGIGIDGENWKLGQGSTVTMVAHDSVSPAKVQMVKDKFSGYAADVQFLTQFLADARKLGMYAGEADDAVTHRLENINELLSALDDFVARWNAAHPKELRLHVRASNEESAVLGGASILRNVREQLAKLGVNYVDYIGMGRGGGGPVAGMAVESQYHEERTGQRTRVWAVGSEIPTVSVADGQAIQNAQALAQDALRALPERLEFVNVPEHWFYKATGDLHHLAEVQGLTVKVEPSAASALARLYAIMADRSQWHLLQPDADGRKKSIVMVLSGMNYAPYVAKHVEDVHARENMGDADYISDQAMYNQIKRGSDYSSVLQSFDPSKEPWVRRPMVTRWIQEDAEFTKRMRGGKEPAVWQSEEAWEDFQKAHHQAFDLLDDQGFSIHLSVVDDGNLAMAVHLMKSNLHAELNAGRNLSAEDREEINPLMEKFMEIVSRPNGTENWPEPDSAISEAKRMLAEIGDALAAMNEADPGAARWVGGEKTEQYRDPQREFTVEVTKKWIPGGHGFKDTTIRVLQNGDVQIFELKVKRLLEEQPAKVAKLAADFLGLKRELLKLGADTSVLQKELQKEMNITEPLKHSEFLSYPHTRILTMLDKHLPNGLKGTRGLAFDDAIFDDFAMRLNEGRDFYSFLEQQGAEMHGIHAPPWDRSHRREQAATLQDFYTPSSSQKPSFDFIYDAESTSPISGLYLQSSEDVKSLWRGMADHLDPGGILIITHHWDPMHDRPFFAVYSEEWFLSLGLELVEMRYPGITTRLFVFRKRDSTALQQNYREWALGLMDRFSDNLTTYSSESSDSWILTKSLAHFLPNAYDAIAIRAAKETSNYRGTVRIKMTLTPRGKVRMVLEDDGTGMEEAQIRGAMQQLYISTKGGPEIQEIRKKYGIYGGKGEGLVIATNRLWSRASAKVTIETLNQAGQGFRKVYFPAVSQGKVSPMMEFETVNFRDSGVRTRFTVEYSLSQPMPPGLEHDIVLAEDEWHPEADIGWGLSLGSENNAAPLKEIHELLESLGPLSHGRFHPYYSILLRIQQAAAAGDQGSVLEAINHFSRQAGMAELSQGNPIENFLVILRRAKELSAKHGDAFRFAQAIRIKGPVEGQSLGESPLRDQAARWVMYATWIAGPLAGIASVWNYGEALWSFSPVFIEGSIITLLIGAVSALSARLLIKFFLAAVGIAAIHAFFQPYHAPIGIFQIISSIWLRTVTYFAAGLLSKILTEMIPSSSWNEIKAKFSSSLITWREKINYGLLCAFGIGSLSGVYLYEIFFRFLKEGPWPDLTRAVFDITLAGPVTNFPMAIAMGAVFVEGKNIWQHARDSIRAMRYLYPIGILFWVPSLLFLWGVVPEDYFRMVHPFFGGAWAGIMVTLVHRIFQDHRLNNKKVFLTGATGTLGKAFVRHLSQRENVSVAGLPRAAAGAGKNLFDRDALEESISKADFVYHFGAWARVGREPDFAEALAVNVAATALITRLSREHGKRLIFPSSGAVYFLSRETREIYTEDDPQLSEEVDKFVNEAALAFKEYALQEDAFNYDHALEFSRQFLAAHSMPEVKDRYGLSKLIAERIVAEYENAVILRLWHTYGEEDATDRRIPTYIRELSDKTKENEPLVVLREQIAFTPIEIAMHALEQAALIKIVPGRRIINVASAVLKDTVETATLIKKELGSNRPIVAVEDSARALPLLKFSNDTASSVFKLPPEVEFERGVRETVQGFLQAQSLGKDSALIGSRKITEGLPDALAQLGLANNPDARSRGRAVKKMEEIGNEVRESLSQTGTTEMWYRFIEHDNQHPDGGVGEALLKGAEVELAEITASLAALSSVIT